MTRRRITAEAPCFDVARAIDIFCQIVARTDALVCATEQQLERINLHDEDTADETITEHELEGVRWGAGDDEGDDYRRSWEHLAHLLASAKESARTAVVAGNRIAAELSKHRAGA